jgi:hypothetical protein
MSGIMNISSQGIIGAAPYTKQFITHSHWIWRVGWRPTGDGIPGSWRAEGGLRREEGGGGPVDGGIPGAWRAADGSWRDGGCLGAIAGAWRLGKGPLRPTSGYARRTSK